MKKLLMIPLLLTAFVLIYPQTRQRITEEVTITRVVVQARVFDTLGRPVRDLGIEDFRLYEDGTRRELQQCLMVERQIGWHDVTLSPAREADHTSRYFTLIFHISRVSAQLREGLEYLFTRILRPQDDLLIMANQRFFFLDASAGSLSHRKRMVIGYLEVQAEKMRDAVQHYSSLMNRTLPRHELDRLKDDNFHFNPVVTEYVRHYYLTLRRYIREVLVPDTRRFYQLASFLNRVGKEKWVINFREKDPLLRTGMADRQIETIRRYLTQEGMGADTFGSEGDDIFVKNILEFYENIDQLFQDPPQFFSRNIDKLFYKTKTTFFTVFIEAGVETEKNTGKLNHLSTVIRRHFETITRKSGGIQITTNQIASALHQISRTTDHYYLLAYTPSRGHTVGKIDVRITDPRLEVVYDDNQRRDHISEYLNRNKEESPGIGLHNIQFREGKLGFSLEGFAGSGQRTGSKGRFEVRIMIKTTGNQTVFNQSKTVDARKERVDIHLDFGWLKGGEYFLVLEARDLVSGKQDAHFSEIRVE